MVFNDKNPIICGVKVKDGVLKIGCPISLPTRNFIDIGKVVSIESNNKPLETAKVGDEVAIKIEPYSQSAIFQYRKHFDHKDLLYSKISRQSLNLIKERYGKELTQEDLRLLVELKKIFRVL